MPQDTREAIELREIAFGLFDGIADDELPKVYPREHAYYEKFVQFEGEFFAPMPMGESRCNVADRVKSVFGTILREADPDRDNPIRNFIIVSHGVTIRGFRMQWLHRPFEWFSTQKNPFNCSIQRIEGEPGRYRGNLLFPGSEPDHARQDERKAAAA